MSVDLFLGLPFNIASYALLLSVLAQLCGLKPRNLTFVGGDVHIYNNHLEQCGEMISRVPYDLPKLKLPEFETLDEFLALSPRDVVLERYESHPPIKAPMAV